jgi:hypothetical protein
MKAAVAEKEAGMTEWNDGRLDELNRKVGDGFTEVGQRIDKMDRKIDDGFGRLEGKIDVGLARLDTKIDDGLGRIDRKFDALDNRFDGFYRVLIQGTVATSVGILGLLGVLIGIRA